MFRKNIIITGATGLLGSYFFKKYKSKYKIIKYPYRIEKYNKFQNWISNKKFDFFIHFASITNNNKSNLKKINLINVKSTINLLRSIQKKNIKNFKYFLFISTSHVYGFSKNKIKENKKRIPYSAYGNSKKRVEDFIIDNRNKFFFKIGIARIFNITGPKQRDGYFIPDIIKKIRKENNIKNINHFRDFIHIDDVCESIVNIMERKFEHPINISSGKKINLISVCKNINKLYFNKKLLYEKKRGKDLFGSNQLLKSLGKNKFKDIIEIIKSYKK